jgi:pimeloyl-ACP methyl ester carboxylesterase
VSVAEWVLSQRYETGTGQIAWDRLGQGPPVVLVHGTPWSSWTWRSVARRRAGRFAVYVFDLLGFGASDRRPEQDVSLAGHGRRLADLLDFWDLARPAVVAHDIGGAATMRAHLLHGRPMAALALIDVVALRPWGSPFFRLARDHNAVFEQLSAAIHEGVLRAYVGTAEVGALEPRCRRRPGLALVGSGRSDRQIAQADERHTDEIEPLYGRVAAPTLVVWGEDDRWIPAQRGREAGATHTRRPPRAPARRRPPRARGPAGRASSPARPAPQLDLRLAQVVAGHRAVRYRSDAERQPDLSLPGSCSSTKAAASDRLVTLRSPLA